MQRRVISSKRQIRAQTQREPIVAAIQNVVNRLDVEPFPVRMHVDLDGGRCFVSSLWSRTVTRVDFAKPAGTSEYRLHVVGDAILGFEPRELCLTDDGKRLVVAGAF